jgi:hypothetical protein
MTEDDKFALKEFMRGVAFTIGLTAVAFLGLAFISNSDVPIPEQSTEVVGKYKGCDIIQWYYGPLAKYQYFLYCQDNGSQI